MKIAIFFDECGSEIAITCSRNETVEQLCARYPEFYFRYWEQMPVDIEDWSEDRSHYYPESDSYV